MLVELFKGGACIIYGELNCSGEIYIVLHLLQIYLNIYIFFSCHAPTLIVRTVLVLDALYNLSDLDRACK
jgi:hypothetical protein